MNNNRFFMNKRKGLTLLAILTGLALVACQKGGGGASSRQDYSIKRPGFTPEYTTYALSEKPSGVNMTYYSDIYSRGFAWVTDNTVQDTKLYLVESDKGEEADFTNAELIEGTSLEFTYEKSGNFKMKFAVPVDQFVGANHWEIFALFKK